MGFLTKFPLLLAASVIAASTNSEPIVYGYGEGVYTKLSFPGVRAECGMAAELAKRGIVTEAVPYEPSPDVGRVQLVTIEPDKLTDTVSAEMTIRRSMLSERVENPLVNDPVVILFNSLFKTGWGEQGNRLPPYPRQLDAMGESDFLTPKALSSEEAFSARFQVAVEKKNSSPALHFWGSFKAETIDDLGREFSIYYPIQKNEMNGNGPFFSYKGSFSATFRDAAADVAYEIEAARGVPVKTVVSMAGKVIKECRVAGDAFDWASYTLNCKDFRFSKTFHSTPKIREYEIAEEAEP